MQIVSFQGRIILSYVARLPRHFIQHYLIIGMVFGKTKLTIKCVLLFCLTFSTETFLIVRSTERDITINVHRFSCNVPVIFVRN